MIEGGKTSFIARRLVISASEDRFGQSECTAFGQCRFEAVMKIGWPEGRIPLAEATVYLATSPKSDSAYKGINDALQLVRQTGNLPVPLHLRNAPTQLMEELGYGKDYKYAHDYQGISWNSNFYPTTFVTKESGMRKRMQRKLNCMNGCCIYGKTVINNFVLSPRRL